MEQFLLAFDKRIPELEKKNRWKTAADIVLQQWRDSPRELNRLLCAGTQLWYTLLVMDYIKAEPFPPDNIEIVAVPEVQSDLMTVTQYGFAHFANNPVFNAYFGYMISVMPGHFSDHNGDYLEWKAKGIEMIHRSYDLAHDNPFTKAIRYELEGYEKDTAYYDACKELWSGITPERWGNSEVQQYFFRILWGDSFEA